MKIRYIEERQPHKISEVICVKCGKRWLAARPEKTIDAAKACVCQNREQEYGAVENNFAMIADFWSVYLGFEITPVDVAMMMNLLKTARIKTGTFKGDSFIDACGYIACAAELAQKGI